MSFCQIYILLRTSEPSFNTFCSIVDFSLKFGAQIRLCIMIKWKEKNSKKKNNKEG